MADMLLHQYADLLSDVGDQGDVAEPEVAVAAPEPDATEDTPVNEPPVAQAAPPDPERTPEEPAQPTPAKPAAQDAISRLREIAARKNVSRDAALDQTPPPATQAPAEPTPEPVEDEATTALKPATRDAYEHVITYIEDRGTELVGALEAHGEGGPAEVMAMTADHIQWLCDYLNENGDDADQALLRMRDTAFDAADMVQLMQMEKRDSAALEAVSLMLQIKRELQADLAA